jgi:hypothetical protein
MSGSLLAIRPPSHAASANASVVRPPDTPPKPRPAPGGNASGSPPCDVALLSILQRPLEPGESAMAGFSRKEHELCQALAALSELESRALHARLSDPQPGDVLAAAFIRLAADRRRRLVNFLADARRRELRRAAFGR